MEVAVEKIIHNKKSKIDKNSKSIGDVTEKIKSLKDLFPKWENEDLITALYDVDGDLEAAISWIMEGNIINKIFIYILYIYIL